VVFSIQTWLGESEDSKKSSGTPGYFSVGMSRTFWPFELFSLSLSLSLTLTMTIKTVVLTVVVWYSPCSGGDVSAHVHSSSRREDGSSGSGAAAMIDIHMLVEGRLMKKKEERRDADCHLVGIMLIG
jgi:hypothetical protein